MVEDARAGSSVELLERFCAAWNNRDVDGLMSMMADECVYRAAAGPSEAGAVFEGREAVRQGYEAVFEKFSQAAWLDGTHVVSGNRGFSSWLFKGVTQTGEVVEVNGCDLFVLRGGKIAVKDSYRKART